MAEAIPAVDRVLRGAGRVSHWLFRIRPGSLALVEDDGSTKFVWAGLYSGKGAGKNNPASVSIPSVGPLPPGDYTIGPAFYSQHSGQITMRLTPDPANTMYGRGAFEMHGDSVTHPGDASQGCIIAAHEIREAVSESGVCELKVLEE